VEATTRTTQGTNGIRNSTDCNRCDITNQVNTVRIGLPFAADWSIDEGQLESGRGTTDGVAALRAR